MGCSRMATSARCAAAPKPSRPPSRADRASPSPSPFASPSPSPSSAPPTPADAQSPRARPQCLPSAGSPRARRPGRTRRPTRASRPAPPWRARGGRALVARPRVPQRDEEKTVVEVFPSSTGTGPAPGAAVSTSCAPAFLLELRAFHHPGASHLAARWFRLVDALSASRSRAMEPGRRRTPTNWGRRATPLDEPLLTPSPGGSTDDGSGDDVAAPSPFALPPLALARGLESTSPRPSCARRRDLRLPAHGRAPRELVRRPPPPRPPPLPLAATRHPRLGTPLPRVRRRPLRRLGLPRRFPPLVRRGRARDDRDGRVRIAAEYVVDAIEGLTHLTFRRDSPRRLQPPPRRRDPRSTPPPSDSSSSPSSRSSSSSRTVAARWTSASLPSHSGVGSSPEIDGGGDGPRRHRRRRVVRLGGERWRAKHWRFVFAAVTVAIWIDAAVCLAATCVAERRAPPWLLSRPTRCLRPLLLVAHVRPLRQLVSSALKTIPRLAPTVSLVGTVVVAWSALGVQLYQGRYDVADADTRGNVFDNAFDATRWR